MSTPKLPLPLRQITRTITSTSTRSIRYTSPSLALAAAKVAASPAPVRLSSSSESRTKPVVARRSAGGYSRVIKPTTGTAAASTSAVTKPTSSSSTTKSTSSTTATRKPRTTTSPKPTSTPLSSTSPLPPHTFDPEPRFATENDPQEDFTFPIPQPVAELPDYANLAPPLNYGVSVGNTASTPSGGQIPHLSESLAPGPVNHYQPQSQFMPQGQARQVEDWTTSFHGLSAQPFEKDVAEVLLRPLKPKDVEIKPDGLLYLPEIKYRRTLNEAFGPGGWGMAPRGETDVGPRIVSREWGLVCLGRLVAIARGEQEYFDPSGVPTATEACKSNALMRCCKDLGIASELWDPSFIREFKAKHCKEAFVEHQVNKKKRKLWRKNEAKFEYPYKEVV